MFFEIDEKTFAVKFSRQGTTTFANLFIVGAGGELVPTEFEGMALLFHTDRFEKSKGRKIALADLLFQFEKPETGGIIAKGLSKEDRKKIWEIYFKTHRR